MADRAADAQPGGHQLDVARVAVVVRVLVRGVLGLADNAAMACLGAKSAGIPAVPVWTSCRVAGIGTAPR
jgi:hypothetical protein